MLQSKITKIELNDLENGYSKASNLVVQGAGDKNEHVSLIPMDISEEEEPKDIPEWSFTKNALLVVFFNVILICFTLAVYFFVSSLQEPVRVKVMDFIIVGGAAIVIVVLYRIGDLSKGRPNFYYI